MRNSENADIIGDAPFLKWRIQEQVYDDTSNNVNDWKSRDMSEKEVTYLSILN